MSSLATTITRSILQEVINDVGEGKLYSNTMAIFNQKRNYDIICRFYDDSPNYMEVARLNPIEVKHIDLSDPKAIEKAATFIKELK